MSRPRAYKEVVMVSKNINSKGKLKGKNKKETKTLIGMCPHHRVTKKGKIRAQIFTTNSGLNGETTIYCKRCAAAFRAAFFQNDEIKDIVESMKELNNQNKFSAVATNAGQKTVSYFSNMGIMLESYPKLSKKLRNVAEKKGNMKKKKRNNEYGSAKYGTWITTGH